MRCDYAHDDGAYVLGALSPTERSSYERHLATCPACREAVAEIAVLPGLLGRLDPATALQLLADDPVDEMATERPWPVVNRGEIGEARVLTLVDRAEKTRRRERRGRRLRYASVALAAACAALIVAVGVGTLRGTGDSGGILDPGTTTQVAMAQMTPVDADVPVEAAIGLERKSWGTEITMDCAYEENAGEAWRLHLIAYGPDKETEQVGSWVAAPGKPVHFKGVTRFAGDQLVRLELTRADGTTMLVYEVP